MQNLSNYSIPNFELIIKFFNCSRHFQFPSSDEMKIFYTEHDFQVDLENLEFNLFSGENTT